MPFQKEFKYPTDEELNVEEVDLSSSTLRAAGIYLGKFCEKPNDEFMLCRAEEYDPRKCLDEGRKVTKCTLDFFRRVKKNCCDEFNQYSRCLFLSSGYNRQKYCRTEQMVLEKCLLDKLNLEKPPFGWQAEVHIHHTDRPKPKKDIAHYPDAADKFPSGEVNIPEPRYGFRSHFGLK